MEIFFDIRFDIVNVCRVKILCRIICKQGYALKNWVEGLSDGSDEAFYQWETPKKIRLLKSVNPTFVSEQKKISIHQ